MNDNDKPVEHHNDAVLRVLGQIEGTMAAMQTDIAEIKAEAVRRDETSSESRRRLHEKIDSVRDGLVKTNGTINVLGKLVDRQGKDIEALKPEVARTASKVRAWSVRGGLLGTALVAAAGFVWWLVSSNWIGIWRFVDQFVPK